MDISLPTTSIKQTSREIFSMKPVPRTNTNNTGRPRNNTFAMEPPTPPRNLNAGVTARNRRGSASTLPTVPPTGEELLREEVQMIRMRTLYQMVNELNVSSGGGSTYRQNVVWLTNKQANTFHEKTMKQLLTALGIPTRPPLVIFLRGGLYSQAMVSNAGSEFLTRVKYGVSINSITLIDDDATKLNASAARFELSPGSRVKVTISGLNTEGQILWIADSGKSAVVLTDLPVVSLTMRKKLVGATKQERENIEKRINIFVSEVLMPLIKKTGALVVCQGVTNCSLCVALGKQFAMLSSQTKGGLVPTAEVGQGRSTAHPRFIGITKYPAVAAAMDRSGSNAHALRTANEKLDQSRRMSGRAAAQSSFLTPQYMDFVKNISGHGDQTAWMQYDLVDGLTDVVLLDSQNLITGCNDNSALMHFVNTFSNMFSGDVPSLSLQFGKCDLPSLVDLVSRGATCMVLDSRMRKCKRRCTLEEALDDLTQLHYDMWKQGAAEMHLSATLAFLHRVLCERPSAKGDDCDENTNSFVLIGQKIKAMEQRVNVEENKEEQEEGHQDHRSSARIAVGDNTNNRNPATPMTFDHLIDRVVDIYKANNTVLNVLNTLHMEVIVNDPNINATTTGVEVDVTTNPQLLECLDQSISELAAKCPKDETGTWLRIHVLLKPAWEKGSFKNSDFFSGNLCSNTSQLGNRLEQRLALVDRLPEENSLQEMRALRDAWCDVDRYELIGIRAKCAAKCSYGLLLVLGVATVVVATLVGSGQFPNASGGSGGSGGTAAGTTAAAVNSSTTGTSTSTTGTFSNGASTGDAVAFLLSVFSSFCASYIGYINPVQRWQHLKSASLQLRSEIFKFRCRIGLYDYKVKTKDVILLRGAVTHLREHTLARAGIDNSTFFQHYPKQTFKHGQYECYNPPQRRDVAYKRPVNYKNNDQIMPDFDFNSRSVVPADYASSSPEWHAKPVVDDYHSPLDAQKYMALRLEPMLRFYQSRIKPYYRSRTGVVVFLMLATGASAVMAALGLTVWIGIIAILASSVTSWSEFSGTGKKLARYASAITKLRDLRLWWETLSEIEQASSKNVTQLVELTEEVLSHDATAWMATSMAAKNLNKESAAAKGNNGVVGGGKR